MFSFSGVDFHWFNTKGNDTNVGEQYATRLKPRTLCKFPIMIRYNKPPLMSTSLDAYEIGPPTTCEVLLYL